jgi:GGDEF domain-containing protein
LLDDRITQRLLRLQLDREAGVPDAGFAVLCIHFDNLGSQLSRVSDREHAQALAALAGRVRACCSPTDSLHIDITGRLFLLVDQAPDCDRAESLAKQLEEAFFHPLDTGKQQLFLTLSIGAACILEPVGCDVPVNLAEKCMLELHETGGRGWRVRSPGAT